MDALRTNKVARLIQKELGELFLEETRKMKGVLISVTEVRLAQDLSSARVFLSIFPDAQAEPVIEAIKERTGVVRYDLGTRLGGQLRRIPELIFSLDTSIQYAQRIDELLALDPILNRDENEEEYEQATSKELES